MPGERIARRRGAAQEPRAAAPVPSQMDDAQAVGTAAGAEASGLRQLDVLAMQRTLGNAATASLLSRAPAASAPVAGRSPLKVQRSFLTKAKAKLRQVFGKKKPLKAEAKTLLADPTWAPSSPPPRRAKAVKAKGRRAAPVATVSAPPSPAEEEKVDKTVEALVVDGTVSPMDGDDRKD